MLSIRQRAGRRDSLSKGAIATTFAYKPTRYGESPTMPRGPKRREAPRRRDRGAGTTTDLRYCLAEFLARPKLRKGPNYRYSHDAERSRRPHGVGSSHSAAGAPFPGRPGAIHNENLQACFRWPIFLASFEIGNLARLASASYVSCWISEKAVKQRLIQHVHRVGRLLWGTIQSQKPSFAVRG